MKKTFFWLVQLASILSFSIFLSAAEAEKATEKKPFFKKVVLILVDGMRSDSMQPTKHPFYQQLIAHSSYSLKVRTVMPSVTLPCHMSLFHSVTPERHGIRSNTYAIQPNQVKDICKVLREQGKKSGMFFSWEELRDLTRPGTLAVSEFINGDIFSYEKANKILTDRVIARIHSGNLPDFTFLYLGWVDEAGHRHGWMGPQYLKAVNGSIDCIQRVAENLPDDHLLVVTADHGGHDRTHGLNIPEDMIIPVFFYHKSFSSQMLSGEPSIMDIAPSIVSLMNCKPDPQWQGKTLL